MSALRFRTQLIRSLVEDSHEAGVFVSGARLLLNGSVVRRTLADEAAGRHGYGVVIVPNGEERSNVTLSGSLLEGNHDAGLLLVGSDGEITQAGCPPAPCLAPGGHTHIEEGRRRRLSSDPAYFTRPANFFSSAMEPLRCLHHSDTAPATRSTFILLVFRVAVVLFGALRRQ